MNPFRFYLDWHLNCQFAGLIWAKHQGLYRQAGLEVELIAPSESAERSTLERVLNDEQSAGCMEDNLIVRGVLAGHSIRAVGAMFQDTPMVLMCSADADIRDWPDLAGKRVAMHEDGVHLLRTILSLHGVDPQTLSISVAGWQLQDLVDRRYDAVQGYSVTEPDYLQSLGYRPRLLPVSHPRIQPYAQMMFTTTRCIERKKEALQQFLLATKQGWSECIENSKLGGRLVAEVSAEQPDADRNQGILRAMSPLVFGRESSESFGKLDTERWRENLITYTEYGLIARRPELKTVIDDRFF